MPLSMLHPAPRGAQRKTRGQGGSLLLSCGALSSPTTRRFIPTITLAYARGSDRSHDREGAFVHAVKLAPDSPAAADKALSVRDCELLGWEIETLGLSPWLRQ